MWQTKNRPHVAVKEVDFKMMSNNCRTESHDRFGGPICRFCGFSCGKMWQKKCGKKKTGRAQKRNPLKKLVRPA